MLASCNPYVRPTVRIPAEAWGIYCEGYYAGICTALRNLYSARDSFSSLEKARRRVAAEQWKATSAVAPLRVDSVEELRMRFHVTDDGFMERGNSVEGNRKADRHVARSVDERDVQQLRFRFTVYAPLDINRSDVVRHVANDTADESDAQLKSHKEIR